MKRMMLRATGLYLAYEVISTIILVFILGHTFQFPGF